MPFLTTFLAALFALLFFGRFLPFAIIYTSNELIGSYRMLVHANRPKEFNGVVWQHADLEG